MDKTAKEHADALLASMDDAEVSEYLRERRRKLNHTSALADQPSLSLQFSDEDWKEIIEFAHRPIMKHEAGHSGLDYLTLTVSDCLSDRNGDDLLFALLRVWRKCFHMQAHLGAIEKLKSAPPTAEDGKQ